MYFTDCNQFDIDIRIHQFLRKYDHLHNIQSRVQGLQESTWTGTLSTLQVQTLEYTSRQYLDWEIEYTSREYLNWGRRSNT